MSRHSKRKRRRRPKSTSPQVPPRPPSTLADRIDERPKAPWHPFPLVELSVLTGLVCIALGFVTRDSGGGRLILGLGFALAALGGLDTSVREHWAGYRSHTLVLAAFPAVVVAMLTALAGAPRVLIPLLAVGVFGAAFLALRRIWDRTSGRSSA